MFAGTTALSQRADVHLVLMVLLVGAVLLLADPAGAVKCGSEAISCGGSLIESATLKVYDTLAQSTVGDTSGHGNGSLRVHDGFWFTLPIADFIGQSGVPEVSADGSSEGVLSLRLLPLSPNPMSEATTVSFEIPDDSASASLAIYNVLGQHVATIVNGDVSRGRHELPWDGTDDHGMLVSSGVYFVRLLVDGESEDRKVMVLR